MLSIVTVEANRPVILCQTLQHVRPNHRHTVVAIRVIVYTRVRAHEFLLSLCVWYVRPLVCPTDECPRKQIDSSVCPQHNIIRNCHTAPLTTRGSCSWAVPQNKYQTNTSGHGCECTRTHWHINFFVDGDCNIDLLRSCDAQTDHCCSAVTSSAEISFTDPTQRHRNRHSETVR